MALTFESIGSLGRLGNQMFQYAALRGIASHKGYDYFIQDSNNELFKYFKIPKKFGKSNSKRLEYSGVDFIEEMYNNCSDNVDLYGYFQSEKYFKNIGEEIRKDFTFYDQIYNLCNHYLNTAFKNQELVSLHIRRIDYLTDENFVSLNIDYYNEALKYFPNLNVLIFSDDPEWCKDSFNQKNNYIIESYNAGIDLCLMSLCSYHIIANSSFSWWGSWLAKSKKTIAPLQWFQNNYSHWNTQNIYLPDWIVL